MQILRGCGCKVAGDLWVWAGIDDLQEPSRADTFVHFLSRQLISIKQLTLIITMALVSVSDEVIYNYSLRTIQINYRQAGWVNTGLGLDWKFRKLWGWGQNVSVGGVGENFQQIVGWDEIRVRMWSGNNHSSIQAPNPHISYTYPHCVLDEWTWILGQGWEFRKLWSWDEVRDKICRWGWS